MPVLLRGGTGKFFEQGNKMIGIFNADHGADHMYLVIRCKKEMLGHFDPPPVQVLDRGKGIYFMKFPAQTVFADAKLLFQHIQAVGIAEMLIKKKTQLFNINGNFRNGGGRLFLKVQTYSL